MEQNGTDIWDKPTNKYTNARVTDRGGALLETIKLNSECFQIQKY